jgi:amino acid adenylation domain-containing protein
MSLLRRFEAQASSRPDAPAIEQDGRTVTYGELRSRVAWLADRLSGTAGRPSLMVMTDDREVIAATLLASVACGWTCALADTDLPRPRVQAITGSLSPDLVVVANRCGPQVPVPDWNGPVLDWSPVAAGSALAGASPGGSGRFVFFTSGTTGRPKGVVSSEGAVAHFVQWEADSFEITEGTRFSQLTSPGYDAVLRDILTPLTSGGTICVPPGMRAPTGDALLSWLESCRVEIVHCTPSVLRTLKRSSLGPACLPLLRVVLVAGEALHPGDVRWWHAALGGRVGLANLYGPSETVMIKYCHRTSAADGDRDLVPVGLPLPGVSTRIVDERGRELAVGDIGEVEIETPFQLDGYLDSPMDSFSHGRSGALTRYRTGDLGRVNAEGLLEVIGRLDDQIKVNGVRIEPGDVERALLTHPDVVDAAVLARAAGDQAQLCAYVVSASGGEVPKLREYLSGLLPPALVPASITRVTELPRTLAGKVNRPALPSPAWHKRPAEPPATAAEANIAAVFGECLNITDIGRFDDLLELGGTSLMALQVIDTVRGRFGVDIPIEVLLEGFTPEALGRYLEKAEERP